MTRAKRNIPSPEIVHREMVPVSEFAEDADAGARVLKRKHLFASFEGATGHRGVLKHGDGAGGGAAATRAQMADRFAGPQPAEPRTPEHRRRAE